MSDELRRAFYATSVSSLDFEAYIPDLHGATEILTEEHRKQLSRHLPARAEGKEIRYYLFIYYKRLPTLIVNIKRGETRNNIIPTFTYICNINAIYVLPL